MPIWIKEIDGVKCTMVRDPHEEMIHKRLDAVKWEMLEEWSRTKRAPKQASFLHASEFQQ